LPDQELRPRRAALEFRNERGFRCGGTLHP
jgi:hypothetical protein